jgi:hypothetical protein
MLRLQRLSRRDHRLSRLRGPPPVPWLSVALRSFLANALWLFANQGSRASDLVVATQAQTNQPTDALSLLLQVTALVDRRRGVAVSAAGTGGIARPR